MLVTHWLKNALLRNLPGKSKRAGGLVGYMAEFSAEKCCHLTESG